MEANFGNCVLRHFTRSVKLRIMKLQKYLEVRKYNLIIDWGIEMTEHGKIM